MDRRYISGFLLLETVLSISLVLLIGGAVFAFVWNIVWLNEKAYAHQRVLLDMRAASERMIFLGRNAERLDRENSFFERDNGRLVLEQEGGSGTVTLSLEDGTLFVDNGTEKEALTGASVFYKKFLLLNKSVSVPGGDMVSFEIEAEPRTDGIAPGFPGEPVSFSGGFEVRGAWAFPE